MSKIHKGKHRSIKTEFKSKITFEIAELIRLESKCGIARKTIAKKYNLSPSFICDIINNKKWIKK